MELHNNKSLLTFPSCTYHRVRKNSGPTDCSNDVEESGSAHNHLKRKRRTILGAATSNSECEAAEKPQPPLLESTKELEGELDLARTPCISAGYADIYHGTWTNLEGSQIEVAAKRLRALVPSSRAIDPVELEKRASTRLRREVTVWVQANHRHIHPLLGYRSKPHPQLISPWCRHGNLTDYLRENPLLSRFDKLRLIRQAALGLAYLHSQKPPVCHADIKPENVLINDSCEAALSDFGLSRVIQDLDTSSGLTTSITPKGTHNYLARELLAEKGSRSSCKSDVYAFGGLVLTIMSERPPFCGESPGAIILRVMLGQSPTPKEHPGLSAEDPLWSLMRQCWESDPAMRPSMAHILIKLDGEIESHSQAPSVAVKLPGHPEVAKKLPLGRDIDPPTPAVIEAQGSAKFQPGRLLIEYEFGPAEYISAQGSGLISTTADVNKALHVKLDRSSRRLHFEGSSLFSRQLGVKWDIDRGCVPKLEKGSSDRAFIAYMDIASDPKCDGLMRETEKLRGSSIWTVADHRRVHIYLRDEDLSDHELQFFGNTTQPLTEDKSFLVVDAESAWKRWPNYERAELSFEPII